MLRMRHIFRLTGDLALLTVKSRTIWLAPIVLAIVVLLALSTASATAIPYTMYTFF